VAVVALLIHCSGAPWQALGGDPGASEKVAHEWDLEVRLLYSRSPSHSKTPTRLFLKPLSDIRHPVRIKEAACRPRIYMFLRRESADWLTRLIGSSPSAPAAQVAKRKLVLDLSSEPFEARLTARASAPPCISGKHLGNYYLWNHPMNNSGWF
jgi:hypothetical protein